MAAGAPTTAAAAAPPFGVADRGAAAPVLRPERLACVMASVMDVGSVLVLSTSALFTRNLLRRFRVREQSHLEIVIGRLFSLVYVGASIALALSFSDVPSAIRFMWGSCR